MRVFTFIGGKLLNVAQGLGEMLALLCETVYYFKEAPRNLTSIFRQMSIIGIGTLPIAMLVALFVGMVLSVQTGSELALYGTPVQNSHFTAHRRRSGRSSACLWSRNSDRL
ncbi:MAG: ABC transporter permease [Desulfuromonadales bacterium]